MKRLYSDVKKDHLIMLQMPYTQCKVADWLENEVQERQSLYYKTDLLKTVTPHYKCL